MLRKVVREMCHLMKGAFKLWDYIGDVLDEVHEAMAKCLQVFKTAVHHWKSGNPAKSKVSLFKVS